MWERLSDVTDFSEVRLAVVEPSSFEGRWGRPDVDAVGRIASQPCLCLRHNIF
jgi:hypothetical protein